jgi:hypothetical protein
VWRLAGARPLPLHPAKRMDRYAFSGATDLSSLSTLRALLTAIQLPGLLDAFLSCGITTVEEFKEIKPEVLEKMGLSAGMVQRLLNVIAKLNRDIPQAAGGAPPEAMEISGTDAVVSGSSGGGGGSNSSSSGGGVSTARAQRCPNSTSSLYIESTIGHPDFIQVCFCVSLVVHDTVVEAEAKIQQQPSSPSPGDPYSLFRPRDIFTLPGKRSRSVFEGEAVEPPLPQIPTDEDIRTSIIAVHRLARFAPGCLVVALIYIERLRRGVGAMMTASTWQPTLLIAIIVAMKVWEDRPHMNVDFTGLCPELTLQQINKLERDFLTLLDYNVGVRASVYTQWYFRLGTLCEKNEIRMRPLDGQEARSLEISASMYAKRMEHIKTPRPNSGPLPPTSDLLEGDAPSSERSASSSRPTESPRSSSSRMVLS